MFTTPALRAERRRGQLAASGLQLLGVRTAAGAEGLPTERSIWRRVADLSLTPLRVIPDTEHDAVYGEWLALAEELQIVGPDRSFLISVPTPGPELGWAAVRATAETRLPNDGIEEFVAVSEDGRRYSAVTAEENGWWLIGGETGGPGGPAQPGQRGGPGQPPR
ncbi:hypothetical protein C5B96_10855 [Subtercola sp. Z020]|uniref:hypothetical protein n=1 Tax=Subtercola sp. Z020 TaxID=2080582 RepID=UPI000CE7992A|nr:hypothetical protein [Subtercola sp. Z020]PPF80585.1 hypothetical protein C5B96_10855 [Subtercola sp. Z020]